MTLAVLQPPQSHCDIEASTFKSQQKHMFGIGCYMISNRNKPSQASLKWDIFSTSHSGPFSRAPVEEVAAPSPPSDGLPLSRKIAVLCCVKMSQSTQFSGEKCPHVCRLICRSYVDLRYFFWNVGSEIGHKAVC